MPAQQRFTIDDLVYILRFADQIPASALARELGRDPRTVATTISRSKRGEMACQLSWKPCTECGEPISGPGRRRAHVACEPARVRRWSREQRERHPGHSTLTFRRWMERHPDKVAARQERQKARRREQWPHLPEEVKQQHLERAHQADARDYSVTAAGARDYRRWTAEEDGVILARLHEPAREVALALGRSLWSVRARRAKLRQREGQGDRRG